MTCMKKLVISLLGILLVIGFVLHSNFVGASAFNCPSGCDGTKIQWPDCTCHIISDIDSNENVYSQCIAIAPPECCGTPGQDNSAARDSPACLNALTGDTQQTIPSARHYSDSEIQKFYDSYNACIHSKGSCQQIYDDAFAKYQDQLNEVRSGESGAKATTVGATCNCFSGYITSANGGDKPGCRAQCSAEQKKITNKIEVLRVAKENADSDFQLEKIKQSQDEFNKKQQSNQNDNQGNGQQTNDQSTQGKTNLKIKFLDVEKNSVAGSIKTILDSDNNPISNDKIKDGLNDKLPHVKMDVPIKNLVAGQSIKVTPPDGFPLQEAIFKVKEKIDSGGIVIEGTLPKLLRGPKPRPLPADDLPPVSHRDNVLYYLSVSDVENAQHQVFEESWFKWRVQAKNVEPVPAKKTTNVDYESIYGMDSEFYPLKVRYKMLHYGGKDWEELPTVLDWCDVNGRCTYVTDPNETGWYAIVEEQDSGNGMVITAVVITLLVALGAGYYFYNKMKK